MTRLRVGVFDVSRVNVEVLESIDSVMGVVVSDTTQIVFGPGTVSEVLDAFSSITGIPKGSVIGPASVIRRRNPADFLKHIANVFVPLLPGIVAAGLINGLANVINVATGGAYAGLW